MPEGKPGGQCASTEEKFTRLLHFIRALAANESINVNKKVYHSEKATGDRNRSLAYFMRDLGVIKGNAEDILDIYFRQCAVEVTCQDLALMGLCIAGGGISPLTS